MASVPITQNRPEDYGFGKVSVPIWCRQFNQWGEDAGEEVGLNENELEFYRAYCQLDATSQWGWGVGITMAEPTVDMEDFETVPEKQKECQVPFFIDHTRKSTQFCKVEFIFLIVTV